MVRRHVPRDSLTRYPRVLGRRVLQNRLDQLSVEFLSTFGCSKSGASPFSSCCPLQIQQRRERSEMTMLPSLRGVKNDYGSCLVALLTRL
jgi:hypothetical protein